jgi:hypothetical protein
MPRTIKTKKLKNKDLTKPLVVTVGNGRTILFGKNEISAIVNFFVDSDCASVEDRYRSKDYWKSLVSGRYQTKDALKVHAPIVGRCVHTGRNIHKIMHISPARFCSGACRSGTVLTRWIHDDLQCKCFKKV